MSFCYVAWCVAAEERIGYPYRDTGSVASLFHNHRKAAEPASSCEYLALCIGII